MGSPAGALARLESGFGFVPRLFRVQTQLRLIDAETRLAAAVLFHPQELTRVEKERILLALARNRRDPYWAALHHQTLLSLGSRTDVSAADEALLTLALKLASPSAAPPDVRAILDRGFTVEKVLEVILTTALGEFFGTLSSGLQVEPDSPPPPMDGAPVAVPDSIPEDQHAGAYLQIPQDNSTDLASFFQFQDYFGFAPALFRFQASRPAVLDAEAEALGAMLFSDDGLRRRQREHIVLAASAANGDNYLVALLAETLAASGVAPDVSYQIAEGHRQTNLPEANKALLDAARKLAADPSRFGSRDVDALLQHGFSSDHVQQAVATVALVKFLGTVRAGLGVKPDFAPRRTFRRAPAEIVNLSAATDRPSQLEPALDPDVEQVAKAQGGDLEAFEVLVNRHSQRVYRTVLGILGSADEARDAMQDTFLKVFQHLAGFERRSKFSTWLLTVASNTALQRLRERRHVESLDEELPDTDQGFRPRQVRAWTEDPEQLYSQSERRRLVEKSVMQLPAKYRIAVMLRDIEQLSAEETAAVLGIGIPALKSRLLRGRLMVREALAPHFGEKPRGVPA